MPKTGYTVQPGITIPSNAISISINGNGQVYALSPGNVTPQLLGQIQTTTFMNSSGLRAIEDSLFLETQASGSSDTGAPGTGLRGLIKQGWREGSNVNAVEEMTDLIKIEKVYEMLTKVIKTGDQMMDAVTHIKA
jgi:flagellar basal-body rod protein FlgG